MTIRTTTRTALAAIAALTLAATAACSATAATSAAGGAGTAVSVTDPGLDTADGQAVQARSAGYTADVPQQTSGQRVITVTATGTATGTPDTLTVQLGVQTRAKTAAAALKDNNAKAAALIASLTKQGIAKKDLATSDLSIYPSYNDNGTTVTGYEVTNTVTATLRDVGKAGSVIDAAASAAGDAIRLNQVGFSFNDDTSLRAAARADAVKQALAQARQLASAAGVALGPVLSITEDGTSSGPQPLVSRGVPAAADASMPVLAGEGQLAITVQVVVSIG